jgi:hypothetical protein
MNAEQTNTAQNRLTIPPSFWKSILVLGVLIIGLVLLADPLGLSGRGFSRGQLLVLLVGVSLVILGGMRERIVKVYQTIAILLLNTIVLLIILEISAGVLSWVISTDEDTAPPANFKLNLSYYQSQDWSRQYWREFNAAEKYRYQPFVGWRRPPFEGETIHVDETGRRVTPNADCQEGAYTVFAFGGSTMWGTGAPDWGTIPAYLQQQLDEQRDQPVCVINFGQSAYVSSQSLIELFLQLKAGNIPDLAVFYDGTNDVFAAYQSGRADAHQNLRQLEEVFLGKQKQSLPDHISETLRQQSYLIRLIDRYLAEDEESEKNLITYQTMGVDAETLAGAVVDNYLANYAFVETLSAAYSFDFAFFWQPALPVSQKPLTPEEQAFAEKLDPDLVALYTATYQRIESQNLPHLIDLSGVLDDSEESLWIDFTHITPVGNQIVAEAMLNVLAQ